MECSPQRFLAGNRNLIRSATLTASAVEAVENSVLETPLARVGSARVVLAGPYSGAEQATYDVEIVDATATVPRTSAPVRTGEGNGTLESISTALAPQRLTIQLADAGTPQTFAKLAFEGVQIVARVPGLIGNNVNVVIDTSGLAFADTPFSLLDDLKAGAGSANGGLSGAAFDWDTKVLGADNVIPPDAHRVAFGDDETVYLQYKEFIAGEWLYHFVPEIARDIPKGTQVKFVTGGRVVTISNGVDPDETYSSIVTDYDLLFKIRTLSTLVAVDGVVANDRSPTGQAAREMAVRTDARTLPSSGKGSAAATGFVDVTVEDDANTELVTARCFAVSAADHPLAHIGAERWKLTGSVSGDLGDLVTGDLFEGETFGLRIPKRLPDTQGTQVGKFTVVGIDFAPRPEGALEAQLCVGNLHLGPAAVDGQVVLTYKARPPADCNCLDLPLDRVSDFCLTGDAGEGGTVGGYTADALPRVKALYKWQSEMVLNLSEQPGGLPEQVQAVSQPKTSDDAFPVAYKFAVQSIRDVVSDFESALQKVDALAEEIVSPPTSYRTDGFAAWDSAFSLLRVDVAVNIGGFRGEIRQRVTATFKAYETLAKSDAVGLFRDKDGVIKARKLNVDYLTRLPGFATAAASAGADVSVLFMGRLDGFTGLTPGDYYGLKTDGSGGTSNGVGSDARAVSATEMELLQGGGNSTALLAERYNAMLQEVLANAGISPSGGADASTADVSGDGCWQDLGDPFYWEVIGPGGQYAQAFNNHIYYSSQRAGQKDKYFSTHEFALQVLVKCPERLLVGDRITLQINGAPKGSTYQVGDEEELPIIAAAPLYLGGGRDGDSTQVWNVEGDVVGPLPNYTLDPDAPTPYSIVSPAALTFQIVQGGIGFVAGDKFTVTIEGGHYRWRKNGGAYSSSLPIPTGAASFDSGLTVEFIAGDAPSFVAGDLYSFTALQPWAVSNVQNPDALRWQWGVLSPDVATLTTSDFVTPQFVDGVALGLHTLPAGATILLEGSANGTTFLLSQSITWREGPMVALVPNWNVRKLRLTVTNAAGGGIGWWWAGSMFGTTLQAHSQLRTSFKIDRANAGLYQGGVTRASADGAEVEWTQGALSDADADGILSLFRWVKGHNDEPFIFVSNITRPEEAVMGRANADELQLVDMRDRGQNAGIARRLSGTLTIEGVWNP